MSKNSTVSREELISMAKGKPRTDPEVKLMLLRWLEETTIPQESGAESVEYIDVAIMHSVMKYRLGFLTKQEVLQELREAGEALASENGDIRDLQEKLVDLMNSIGSDQFEILGL